MQHKLSFALLMGLAVLPATGFAQVTTITTETINTAPLTESGFVNQDVELYSGPDYNYPEVAVMPAQETMVIYGCVEGYDWCDVSAAGIRGWVSGENLYLHPYEQPIVHYGPHLTVLPIVVFNRDNYWDHWYRSRPFYHNWYQSHPRERVIHAAPEQIIIREQPRPVIHNTVIVRDRVVHPVNRPVVIEHPVVTHQKIRHEALPQPHQAEHPNEHHDGEQHHDRDRDHDHDDGHRPDGDHDRH